MCKSSFAKFVGTAKGAILRGQGRSSTEQDGESPPAPQPNAERAELVTSRRARRPRVLREAASSAGVLVATTAACLDRAHRGQTATDQQERRWFGHGTAGIATGRTGAAARAATTTTTSTATAAGVATARAAAGAAAATRATAARAAA